MKQPPALLLFAPVLLLLASCHKEPDPQEVDRLFNKYADTAAQLTDTVIDYRVKGDSLILHFPGEPKIRNWNLAYRMEQYYPYELDARNEVVIVNEDVRRLNDTSFFTLSYTLIVNKKLFIYSGTNTVAGGRFESRPGHQLYRPAYNVPIYSYDYKLYDDIKDDALRYAVISKINKRLGLRGGNQLPWDLNPKNK